MSRRLYCCYCGSEKGNAISCCHESDFVPFDDLPEDMQDELLDEIDTQAGDLDATE